ncbi:hypothetical protein LguiB_010878 [Lonicera macranthoides]
MSIENDNYHHHIPQEVIIEILSRLPVKTLLKFKSVCKNWYAIIKSTNFISKHLHNHYDNDTGGLLLIQRFIPESRLYGFELFTDKTLATDSNPIVDPYLQNTAFAQSVLGPLNGLYVLFNRKDRLALWNPAIREFKPLPSHPITDQIRAEDYMNDPTIGFGFDTLTNDYKVVWFIPRRPAENNIFLLYTLSNDSWREVMIDGSFSDVYLHPSTCNANTFWNGSYYWVAPEYNDQRGNYFSIYAFDMINEVLSAVQCPPVYFYSLIMYNGRIATFFVNGMNIDIWVMESVGIWTKQLTIGPLPNVREFRGCWINGGIFVETNDYRLILCNPNQELRDLGPRRDSYIYIHNESLVSLKCRNGNRKEDVSTDLVAPIRDFFNLYRRRSCIYG